MGGISNLRHAKFPGDIAVFDVVLTIAVAWIYSIVRKKTFVSSVGLFFILAIVVHYLLNIPTRLNAHIGLNSHTAVDQTRST